MTVEFLYSVHGTLIYYDESTDCLRHGRGPGVPSNAGVVTDDGGAWLACRVGSAWRRLDRLDATGQVGLAGANAAPLRVTKHRRDGELIALAGNGVWLCAEADGTITLSRKTAGPWETFFPVTEAENDFIVEIGGQDWIASGGGIVDTVGDVIHGATIEANYLARIGKMFVPIRDFLSARHRRHGEAWTLIYDGWRVEYLTAYRPLIYMIAYGKPEIFETMALLLRSLTELGRYTGDVLIFSDKTRDQLEPFVPPALSPRVRVAAAPVRDVTDMMAIKYRICDMPELAAYQPILYLDTDIICNAPLDPLLGELSRGLQVSVPLEMDLMGSHNYYGSVLFSRDPTAVIRHERGFSAGLMGIPNIEVARQVFPTIVESIYGLASQQADRGAMGGIFYDQGVANYVMHKVGAADFEIMTRYVVTPVDFKRPVSEIPRLGFAHFAGGVGDAGMKLPAMRDYWDFLRDNP